MKSTMKHTLSMQMGALTVIGSALAAGPAAQPGTQPAAPPTTQPAPATATTPVPASRTPELFPRRSPDRYEVLVQRNIFLRHSGGEGRSEGGGGRSPAHSAGASWALTGIVLIASDQVAFIENMQTGETLRLRAGQDSPAGRILRIAPDYIELAGAESLRRIDIGLQLNGEIVAATPSSTDHTTAPSNTPAPGITPGINPGINPGITAGNSAASGSNSGGASGSNSGGASGGASGGETAVLERLRARRNQQVGGPRN